MSETTTLKRAPLTDEAIELLKKTECKGWSPEQIELFVYQCNRTGLDPLTRQIYGQLRWDKSLRNDKGVKVGGNKLSVVTSIDGFRLVAERTGEYQGQTEPLWCGEDGVWKDVWIGKKYPAAAKVGVWRKDFKEPLIAVANFDAYAPTYDDGNLSGLWPKMYVLMISKCAEALALRKAFPNELSGIYTSDEMAQAGKEETPEEPKEERKPDPRKGETSAHTDEPEPEPEQPGEEGPDKPTRPPEGRSGPKPPRPAQAGPFPEHQGKGLAGSKAAGGLRRVTPAPTPDNPMRHPTSDNDGRGEEEPEVGVPVDQWHLDDLRKLPTLGGKTLGQLRPDQLQKLADMGEAYVEQGKKLGKDQLAQQALDGAKALIAYDKNDSIPGL